MKTFSIFKRNLAVNTMLVMLVFCSISYGNPEPKPMPESNYVEFLDKAAALMKANYDKIDTWQGEFRIEEDDYSYDKQCRLLDIDANDPASRSKAIRRSIDSSAKFAINTPGNKLYYEESMPKVKYHALDLDKDVVVDKVVYSSIVSIVTPDEYLSFMPNFNYGYNKKQINGKWSGPMAFRLPLEKAKNEQWSNIRDPRKYFSEGHRMMWEDIEVLRNLIANPSPDIPEGKAPQISIMTEGTKTYIKTRFYSGQECKGCENEFVNINITLDNSVEYNVIHREVLNPNNEILQTFDVTYEKINQIYVPKIVHYVTFRSSDLKKSFDSKITFTKSILNVSIPAETFTCKNLGLKENDAFTDKIQKKEYKYQDANLVFVKDVND
jgi:hypothetical protein